MRPPPLHFRGGQPANGSRPHPSRTHPGTAQPPPHWPLQPDRKSTRLNSSHVRISYAVFCLKKKKKNKKQQTSLKKEKTQKNNVKERLECNVADIVGCVKLRRLDKSYQWTTTVRTLASDR